VVRKSFSDWEMHWYEASADLLFNIRLGVGVDAVLSFCEKHLC
jgi:hypothetical protein